MVVSGRDFARWRGRNLLIGNVESKERKVKALA
jgi:hypothetical protein